MEKLRNQYQIDEIVFVADRGMLSESNIHYLEANHFRYIVGARIKGMSKALKNEILDLKHYQVVEGETGSKVAQFKLAKQRCLIVSYSPERARKDSYDREKAIEKLQSKLKRSHDPKSLLSNYGYKKYIELQGDAKININQAKLADDAQWDGRLGVLTNIEDMPPREVLAQYRNLWQIEACFRINKHDLKIRPIYHWTSGRIKAHVAISFMAFVCVKYLEYRFALQSKAVSPETIRQALLQVEATTIHDKGSNQYFILPSKINTTAKEIYRVMGIKLPSRPIEV